MPTSKTVNHFTQSTIYKKNLLSRPESVKMKAENARTQAQGHQPGEVVQTEAAEVVEEEANPEHHIVLYVRRTPATSQENANTIEINPQLITIMYIALVSWLLY